MNLVTTLKLKIGPKFRQSITNVRISAHKFPIEIVIKPLWKGYAPYAVKA